MSHTVQPGTRPATILRTVHPSQTSETIIVETPWGTFARATRQVGYYQFLLVARALVKVPKESPLLQARWTGFFFPDRREAELSSYLPCSVALYNLTTGEPVFVRDEEPTGWER